VTTNHKVTKKHQFKIELIRFKLSIYLKVLFLGIFFSLSNINVRVCALRGFLSKIHFPQSVTQQKRFKFTFFLKIFPYICLFISHKTKAKRKPSFYGRIQNQLKESYEHFQVIKLKRNPSPTVLRLQCVPFISRDRDTRCYWLTGADCWKTVGHLIFIYLFLLKCFLCDGLIQICKCSDTQEQQETHEPSESSSSRSRTAGKLFLVLWKL